MKLGGGEHKRINSLFQLLLSVYNYLVSDACNKAALYRVWFLERRQWHPIGKILGLHPPNRRSVWLMWKSYNSCWKDTAEDCGCVAGEGAELSSIDIWFPLYNNWPLLPAPPPPHLSIAVAWDLLFQSSSHIPCMRRAPGNPTRGAASKTHSGLSTTLSWAKHPTRRGKTKWKPNHRFSQTKRRLSAITNKKRIAENQDSWQALQMRSLGLEMVLKSQKSKDQSTTTMKTKRFQFQR